MSFLKGFAVALVVSSIGASTSFGAERVGSGILDRRQPERVSVTGTVTCRNGKPHPHKDCDLRIVDAKSGAEYTVEGNEALLEEVCEEGGSVGAQVTGELSIPSLFYGQTLSVERFGILEHSSVAGE